MEFALSCAGPSIALLGPALALSFAAPGSHLAGARCFAIPLCDRLGAVVAFESRRNRIEWKGRSCT